MALTLFALIAFASNSLLCREALRGTTIDAASFTSIRLLSGSLMLLLVVMMQRYTAERRVHPDQNFDYTFWWTLFTHGSWWSSLALFVYAAAFSFSYRELSAGTGALLLFGSVQVTMIGYSMWTGARYSRLPIIGFILAAGGLVGIVLPGATAPPLVGALLMILAGIAWGIYSIRGTHAGNPVLTTSANFLMTLPFVLILSLFTGCSFPITTSGSLVALHGVLLAVASGAIASALGYIVWYAALKKMNAGVAATVQLSVPVIAAIAGVGILDEQISLRLIIGSIVVLGGVLLVIKTS